MLGGEDVRFQGFQMALQLFDGEELALQIGVVVTQEDLFGHDLAPLMHDQRPLVGREDGTERDEVRGRDVVDDDGGRG